MLGLIGEFRVRYDTLLFVLERADSPMVLDPVLGVLAQLINLNWLIPIDRGTTMGCKSFQVFELLGSHEDLLLRDLDDGAIEILEEQAIFLQHFLLDLHDLDEVDEALDSVLVANHSLLRDNDAVLLLRASDHPLQILDRDFMVEWNEERFESTRQPPVEVQDSPIHVDSDHKPVPEVPGENSKRHHHKECDVAAYDAVITCL